MHTEPKPEKRKVKKRLRLYHWVAVTAWTVLVGVILSWSLKNADQEVLGLARLEAIANFDKDQAFRSWASNHGGVYVPITEDTPPNPYLSDIPEQNITTPSGRKLTLMNPAYMLRQVMHEYGRLYGTKGRITSLNPINPSNAPDKWETEALKSFERGEKERFEITDIDGKPYLRLIRPMITQKGCLKCHGEQGYKVGDVRGGVGVAVPMSDYLTLASKRKWNLSGMLSVVWIMGLVGIWYSSRRARQRLQERVSYEGRIWHQANFEPLTELPNRNLFMDRLERAIAQARRDKRQLALLFIDLDQFKAINDTKGHEIGDSVLQAVALRLLGCVRDMDTVSRLGGDEFTVVLPGMKNSAAATRIANEILQIFSQPFEIDDQEFHLSASIGIALFPQDGSDPITLLKSADTAMYQAKSEGRNTYRYFTWEMNQRAEAKVAMEMALRRALKQDEFALFYQPIVDITGELVGAEALVRWNSPQEDTQVNPADFIPAAEENGLIIPLGDWILEQAASDLRQWDKSGLHLQHLAVNLSVVQLRREDFADKITDFLGRHSQLHSRFCLEITESIFLDEQWAPGAFLETLRHRGISVAIDDFGTGYSSLGYLKRFPVDLIKIDQSFVSHITTDSGDATLCEAIIAMAHALNTKVIAEGVETEEQWQFLRDRNCDFAQGYLFGKPMPSDKFSRFLGSNLAKVC